MKADIVPISAIMNASREIKASYIEGIILYQGSAGKVYTKKNLKR